MSSVRNIDLVIPDEQLKKEMLDLQEGIHLLKKKISNRKKVVLLCRILTIGGLALLTKFIFDNYFALGAEQSAANDRENAINVALQPLHDAMAAIRTSAVGVIIEQFTTPFAWNPIGSSCSSNSQLVYRPSSRFPSQIGPYQLMRMSQDAYCPLTFSDEDNTIASVYCIDLVQKYCAVPRPISYLSLTNFDDAQFGLAIAATFSLIGILAESLNTIFCDLIGRRVRSWPTILGIPIYCYRSRDRLQEIADAYDIRIAEMCEPDDPRESLERFKLRFDDAMMMEKKLLLMMEALSTLYKKSKKTESEFRTAGRHQNIFRTIFGMVGFFSQPRELPPESKAPTDIRMPNEVRIELTEIKREEEPSKTQIVAALLEASSCTNHRSPSLVF